MAEATKLGLFPCYKYIALGKVGRVRDEVEPSNDDKTNGKDRQPRKALLEETAGGAMEMATVLNEPGMKRSESSEILHLTLHQCARDGNADTMRRLLEVTVNVKKKVNQHDDEGLSSLHYAARYNHYPIVVMLISAGANVNDIDEEGATPLHFAARYKRMRLQVDGEVRET
ncbi:hypothetical protein LSAT2_022671 [Lamellibrachia satsuma]|nr:hypothetical protein LSAT2_022671 [Lamellibrachia satsuma]